MAKFSVAARTLVHLGAELITSDEVAVNELIKNAFDAESLRVRIDFHIAVPQLVLKAAIDSISGLKEAAKISAAIDAARKNIGGAIGHLAGTERVAIEGKLKQLESAEMATTALRILESLNTIVITDSGTGMSKELLEEVFLRIGTPSRLTTDTSPTLNRQVLGNKGIGRLAMMRLGDRAEVISWVDPGSAHIIEFDWRDFDAPNKSIDDVPLVIRPSAHPTSSPTGTVVRIAALKTPWSEESVRNRLIGHFLRRLQNPFAEREVGEEEAHAFPIDVHVNGGARIPIEGMKQELLEHVQVDLKLRFDPSNANDDADEILVSELTDHRRGRTPQLTSRSVTEVCHAIAATLGELRVIGPFRATLRWFNRDRLRQQATLHGNWKQAREELDIWSGGIAVYRDDFRVGFTGQSTGEDWLGLDSSALKRSGFTVNRIQLIGALEISRRENPALIDRSNREGLIESREGILVRELLRKFAIDELRRYIDEEGREEKIAQLTEVVESAPLAIRARVIQAEQGLSEIRAKVPTEVRKTVQSISSHLQFIKGEVKRFEDATRQAGERREDILELAGVGTVMAGVLHELTRTTGNTRQLLQKLAKDESPKTKALLDKLDAEVKAINTRLRQLDPLTPSGRHRKEEFDLSALLTTIVDGYSARLERHRITCQLTVSGQEGVQPVRVKMVRGFVSLAVENMLTNSIYWLQHGLRAGEHKRSIELELDPRSKTLTVRDNGPGIAAADRERIFTAGFSLRPRGQGLGLFIAAEVATYHGAKLVLEPPDSDGRYRGFVLELPKD